MANPIQFANGPLPQAANTTLAGAIPASGGTTVAVASAAFLPAAGPFQIVVDNERIEVDSISGTNLTILAGGRGQEGTAAAAHASGASVYQVLSVANLARHIDERAGAVRMGCRLRRAANQSVTASTPTAIGWDTEDQDTDGLWSAGATITIPADGLWAITARLVGTITGATRAWVELAVTSAIVGAPVNLREMSGASEGIGKVSVTIPLLAADTFAVQTYYGGIAGPVNFTGWVSCYRVGL